MDPGLANVLLILAIVLVAVGIVGTVLPALPGKVGFGTWLGLLIGIAGKLALIFTMVGIFALAYVL
jgi:hypothetical protein